MIVASRFVIRRVDVARSVAGRPTTRLVSLASRTHLQVRAKLPTGQGVWPAHWLMPDWTGNGSCWPAAGEIDIMERIDTVYMVHGALHWSGNGSCGTADEKNGGNWSNTLPFDPSDDFHTYGVVWTNVSFAPPSPGYAFSPDSLYYYIDEDIYTSVSNVSLKFPQVGGGD